MAETRAGGSSARRSVSSAEHRKLSAGIDTVEGVTTAVAPDPGVEANARLTAWTGTLLFVLFAVEGLTVLAVRLLLPAHEFVGLVLVPPVLLKFGSTFYRFAGYYLRRPRYRAAGPPALWLRLLGPVMIVSTIAVLGTGIELWLFGFKYGSYWLELHKLSFVLWFGATSLHVLGHLLRTPNLVWRDVAERPRVAGRVTRGSLVLAALLLGLVLAIALMPFPSPFTPPLEQ